METSLKKEKLYGKLSMCEFWPKSFSFLGYIVPEDEISGDPWKVDAMKDWLVLKSMVEVKEFPQISWILLNVHARFLREDY